MNIIKLKKRNCIFSWKKNFKTVLILNSKPKKPISLFKALNLFLFQMKKQQGKAVWKPLQELQLALKDVKIKIKKY